MIELTKKDVAWSYSAQTIQYGANIFILPLVLHLLPSDQLGIWYIFLSVSGLVQLLDFGFQPTISRNMTYLFSGAQELRKEGMSSVVETTSVHYRLLKNFISTCRRLYGWIGIGTFVLLISLGTFYINSISGHVHDANSVRVAWFIFVLSSALNLCFIYFSPFLMGRGMVRENYKTVAYSKVAYVFLSFAGLETGFGLIALASANLASVILGRVLSAGFFYDHELRTKLSLEKSIHPSESSLFTVLWHNSYKMGLVSLGAFLITRSNLILGSKFLSLSALAEFGLAQQILNVLYNLSVTSFNIYMPTMTRFSLTGDSENSRKTFGTTLLVAFGVFIFGALCLIFFGPPLLKLIGSRTQLLPPDFLAFYAIVLLLELNHTISAGLITTKNTVPFVAPSLLSGAAIVALTFALLRYSNWGLWALLVPQFVVQLSYNNWKWPHVVSKDLDVSYPRFFSIGINVLKGKVFANG